MKKAFTIPLSPQVLKILNKLKTFQAVVVLFFQSQRYPERPFIQALPMQQLNALVSQRRT